jgi:extradiol dioxygenase family protein
MNKRIIYTNENEELIVVVPNFSIKKDYETWENFYNRIKEKDVPFGVKASVVEESEIPTNREYRDLWEIDLYDRFGSIKKRAPKQ